MDKKKTVKQFTIKHMINILKTHKYSNEEVNKEQASKAKGPFYQT